jgi:hypothetical protein
MDWRHADRVSLVERATGVVGNSVLPQRLAVLPAANL